MIRCTIKKECRRVANHRGNCSPKPIKICYRMLPVGNLAQLDDQFRGLGLKTIITISPQRYCGDEPTPMLEWEK
jgi:hypothetical protein